MSKRDPVRSGGSFSPGSSEDGASRETAGESAGFASPGLASEVAAAASDSESQFRALVEGSGQGLCVHKDWKLLYANRALAEILGYGSAEEILALKSLGTIFVPEERDRLWGCQAAGWHGGPTRDRHEARCLRKDGSVVWVEIRVDRVVWQGAEATLSALVDITKRKKSEMALRWQNAHLRTALDKMSQGVCMFDGEQRLVFGNARYAEIYNLPAELLVPGTRFRQILEHRIAEGIYAGGTPEDYVQERCAAVAEGAASTKVQCLTDGRIISISHRPMPGGGWLGTHDDITELRAAEAALRESEELFSRAFQASPAACAISAPEDGHHYDVNEGWMDLLGYTREEALANSALTLGIWADPKERARFVGLLEKHGSFKAFETKFRRKNGEIIDVLVSGVYVDFLGEPRLFVVYEDVTKRKQAEAALRESEELFSKAFHTSPAACAIAAPEDGRHYDVNEKWMELLGYTREEALASSALKLGIWADPKERARFVGLLETHGNFRAFEAKFRRKNGELIDVLVSGVYVEFHGEPRLFVVYDDITKRKQAEAALRESEELFSKAFHTSPTACAIAAPEDGRHYDVNEGWTKILGHSREEALANSAVSLGIWADPRERARFVELLETQGSVEAFETEVFRKDGEKIDILISAVHVEFHGEPRIFSVFDDITQRKKSERLLAHQASTMSLMKSIAFTANQSTDLEGALSFCLEKICDYTGWDVGHVYMPAKDRPGSLVSAKCWFLSDEERFRAFKEKTEERPCRPEDEEMCCGVLEGGEACWADDVASRIGPWRVEAARASGLRSGVAFPIKIRNVVVAILEFYATRGMDPTASLVDILTEVGTQMGRVVERANAEAELVAHRDHLEDLVDKRTAQVQQQTHKLELALAKERELNALQQQFVAMASHEFRTPLTIIDSAAQRLERRAEKLRPADVVQRTQKIRTAVKRMVTLIESVLSSASFDAGKFKVEVQPYDLRALVAQACARQREISPLHNIVADLDALPTRMIGDPNLLEQVFANLLSNAVKYAPDKPDVSVVGRVEAGSVRVAIEDQGVGIPAKDIAKLFDRFFRASTSTGIAGTGIGLSLVSQIVELHGGRIDVESVEGEGSTFIVQLPLRTGAEGAGPLRR